MLRACSRRLIRATGRTGPGPRLKGTGTKSFRLPHDHHELSARFASSPARPDPRRHPHAGRAASCCILRFSLDQYDLDRTDDRDIHRGKLPRASSRTRSTSAFCGTTLTVAATVHRYSACVLGIPIAYRLARMTQPLEDTACMLALVLPLVRRQHVVRMVGWMILFAHGGMIDTTHPLPSPAIGLELMYTTVRRRSPASFPSTFRSSCSRVQSTHRDHRSRGIEEAARSLGAAPDPQLLARRLAAGTSRHRHRRHSLLHPRDERLRHALPA